MLKKVVEIVEEPKIVGQTKIVICSECQTIQTWDEVLAAKRCIVDKLTRGWRKCGSKTFLEVEK